MSTKVRVNLREMYPKYYNQECFVEVDQDVYETMNKYDHIDAVYKLSLIHIQMCIRDSVNRLSATASIHRYASIKELKEKQSSFNYSLNGSWKFHYADVYKRQS